MVKSIIAVGVGGALGAILRMVSSSHLPAFFFTHFPAPIFLINVLGCFLMGVLVELMASWGISHPHIRDFLTTGFLGGFTTFSAFSLEYALILERGFKPLGLYLCSCHLYKCVARFFRRLENREIFPAFLSQFKPNIL